MTATELTTGRGTAPSLTVRLSSSRLLRKLPLIALVGVLGFLVVQPLYRLQSLALEDNARGYRSAFGAASIGDTLRTTLMLAVGSLAIALVLGTALAWWSTRLPRWASFLRIMPIMPIVIPASANIVAWVFLFSPRPGFLNGWLRALPWFDHLEEGPVDIYSLPWIIILTGFSLTAFVYLFVSGGLANINDEHLEAAQVAGDSPRRVFFRVTLPLLRPVLLYGAGVALLLGLGQFTAPLLLGRTSGTDVLTTDMYRAVSSSPIDYAVAAALGSPLLVLGLVVVVVQKFALGDQKRFVTHGGKGFQSTAKSSNLAVFALGTFGVIAVVLPILALVAVALTHFWSGDIVPSEFTLDSFRTVFAEADILDAIKTSVVTSLGAIAFTVPFGFFVARTLVRPSTEHRVLRSIIDFIAVIPLGVPAVTFGAGFLLTYTREPFVLYGSGWVIVLVYITLMIPFTVRMQMSGMLALGESYVEASRVSGAGPLRTNLKILIPLMRGSMAAAGALMFVLLTHEFSASMLVRSSDTQVMGTILYDYWTNGAYPLVAAISLVMTGVTAVGVIVAMAVGGSNVLSKL